MYYFLPVPITTCSIVYQPQRWRMYISQLCVSHYVFQCQNYEFKQFSHMHRYIQFLTIITTNLHNMLFLSCTHFFTVNILKILNIWLKIALHSTYQSIRPSQI